MVAQTVALPLRLPRLRNEKLKLELAPENPHIQRAPSRAYPEYRQTLGLTS